MNSLGEILWNQMNPGMELPQVTKKGSKQRRKKFAVLSEDEIRNHTDRTHKACPFHGLVGQNNAIEQLLPILAAALSDEHHSLPGTALLMTGPASSGKTEMSRRLAAGLAHPFVETDANQVKSVDDIFALIESALKEADMPLVELGQKNGKTHYCVPEIVVFIDEFQAIKPAMMNGLLKALESKDRLLLTETAIVDVRHVIWIGATTDRGDLANKARAIDSRFIKVEFHSYNTEEVAAIVKLNFPSWSKSDCNEIAIRSGRITRQAIDMGNSAERQLGFMRLHDKNATRSEAITIVSKQSGIDEYGMSDAALKVLSSLARAYPKGLNYGQMSKVINRGVAELKQFVLPLLTVDLDDSPASVTWTGQRAIIREQGMKELLKRDLITKKDFEAYNEAEDSGEDDE